MDIQRSDPASESPTAAAIGERLTLLLAEALEVRVEDISPVVPILDYGIDSFTAATLGIELESWLNIEVSALLVWDFPTIAEMSAHLAEQASRACRQDASSIPVNPHSAR